MDIKTKSANFHHNSILIRQLIQFKYSKYREMHHQRRQYSLNTTSPGIDNFQKSFMLSIFSQKNRYVKKQRKHFNVWTMFWYNYMKSARNDDRNLSGNTHVRSILYRWFYHDQCGTSTCLINYTIIHKVTPSALYQVSYMIN